MPSSYSRNCRNCGRRIQLRQMPAGQWVAFEGYDTQHDCKRPPSGKGRQENRSPNNQQSPYDGLDFPEGLVVHGDSPNLESKQEHASPSKSATPQSRRKKTSRRYSPKKRRMESDYGNLAANTLNSPPTINKASPQPETPPQVAAPQPQISLNAGTWLFIILIFAGLAYYIFSSDSNSTFAVVL